MEAMVQSKYGGYISRAVKSCDILVMKLSSNTALKNCPYVEQHVTNFKVLDLFGLVVLFIYSLSMCWACTVCWWYKGKET